MASAQRDGCRVAVHHADSTLDGRGLLDPDAACQEPLRISRPMTIRCTPVQRRDPRSVPIRLVVRVPHAVCEARARAHFAGGVGAFHPPAFFTDIASVSEYAAS